MKFAYIEGDTVIDLVGADPFSLFFQDYASQFIEVGDDVERGYVMVDGVWVDPLSIPPQEVIPQSITPRQIRLQLSAIGMRQAVEDYVASASLEIKDWWEFSLAYERNAPLLVEAATALGLTSEQLDQFFVEANKL